MLPQLECTQTKFLSRFLFRLVFGLRRRACAVEGERGSRILLPDGNIFRSNRQPAKFEHVAAWFGHHSDLRPGDFIDSQSFPLRLPRGQSLGEPIFEIGPPFGQRAIKEIIPKVQPALFVWLQLIDITVFEYTGGKR